MSRDKFEEDQEVAVEEVPDGRNTEKAREGNDMMSPEREEIEEAMREMKESAPGEGGVQISLIQEPTEEIKERFVELVRFMFEEGAEG